MSILDQMRIVMQLVHRLLVTSEARRVTLPKTRNLAAEQDAHPDRWGGGNRASGRG